MSQAKEKKLTELSEAFLGFKSLDEAKAFLVDLLSETELTELEKRWYAAQKLSAGSSYSQIEKETGLSSTTVARVSKSLKSEGQGYARAIINK